MVGPRLFDAHLHIVDPRFPLIQNQGYLPSAFTVADYLGLARPLGITGGALVSGSFQGFNLGYLEDALPRLGSGYVGVVQLPLDTPVAEIRRLDDLGVRAVRFNLHRGVQGDLAGMLALAERAHEAAGWHAELYLDAAEVPHLRAWLGALPAICIDHLGLTRAGLPHLIELVAASAWVKATGFARLDFPVGEAMTELCRAAPNRVLWGSDLPGTRAPRPFEPKDLDLIAESLGDPVLIERVLWGNALALYRPRAPGNRPSAV
jgi:predicted TIM-barrel fold metal-dependent hydrolase